MMTDQDNRPHSDLAIPPGELLEEELAAIGMTQQELAFRTARPVQAINEIIRGKKQITHDTALSLNRARYSGGPLGQLGDAVSVGEGPSAGG